MNHPTRQYALQTACPDLDPALIKDFVTRMDPDYFDQYSLEATITHLQLVGKLNPDHPCALHITKEQADVFEVTIVAYDYFSEFATICGILSAFGLDIQEALIFTYTDEPSGNDGATRQKIRVPRARRGRPPSPSHRPGLARKKVVDVFRVQLLPGFTLDHTEQTQLSAELEAMIRLLDTQHIRDARRQVNRRLTETLGKLRTKTPGFIHPVQILFDNNLSPNETVIDIDSVDTPAFLYAFANALAMRGIYIAKAKVDSDGLTVRNRFYVKNRHGEKLKKGTEQQELTVAAALIKEFTHFLTWAPDPAKALEHFDQLLDQLLEEPQTVAELSLLTQKPLLGHLARLFGSSDFLWEDFLRRQHTNLLPAMEEFKKRPQVRSKAELTKGLQTSLKIVRRPDERKKRLNEFKDRELFRIDMKHLLENTPLPDFSHALTNLADVILNQALMEAQAVVDRSQKRPVRANGHPYPFTICGVGKLGGTELGYASDIEVLFVYDTNKTASTKKQTTPSEYFEALVQEILGWIDAKQEGIFHIDTRLRPHGKMGLFAHSLVEIRQYYSPKGQAAPFERQALIKLRYVAGDAALGDLVEKHRDEFVYSQVPWPLDTAVHLRDRQTKELVPAGAIHVKYSPGGLVDIEYTAQYLQVMHGHRAPSLQTPNTLQALDALAKEELLTGEEAQDLKEDYLFLRQVIDALRIVRGNAKDLVLPKSGSNGLIFLARRMGFITEDWLAGAKALEQEIQRRMKQTRQVFTKHFMNRQPERQKKPRSRKSPSRKPVSS